MENQLDNGAPCIDLMWDDGSIVAKSFSQSNAKYHNPRANNMQPNTNKEETNVKTQDMGPKMTLEGGKMVVEDADGTLMGHIVPDNSWLRRGLRIEGTFHYPPSVYILFCLFSLFLSFYLFRFVTDNHNQILLESKLEGHHGHASHQH